MADLSLTLTGDRQLAAQFDALSDAVRGQVLKRAVVAGALLIANDAKARAPYRTGNYRRSIHVGGEGVDAQTTGTDIGGQEIGADYAEVKIGSNVEYGIYLELGTRHMAARPHLRPAVESQRGAVEREVADALRDLLRSAV